VLMFSSPPLSPSSPPHSFLHDALPICALTTACASVIVARSTSRTVIGTASIRRNISDACCSSRTRSGFVLSQLTSPDRVRELQRSEEHTSELQSLRHLVCRLLLDK